MLITPITNELFRVYKILVTGGNGQLGSEIKELSSSFTNDSFFFTDTSNLDITNHAVVAAFIKTNNIDVIVNCAAYTAVDKAESEPELADAINHLAVKNLAIIAKERGAKLIHISTDYVFNGDHFLPYKESDSVSPIGVYGKTKREGELAVINSTLDAIVIRTSWLYSSYGNNFVKNNFNGKQACCACDATPPMGKNHPFSKIAVTLEPVMQFGCPSRFRISKQYVSFSIL